MNRRSLGFGLFGASLALAEGRAAPVTVTTPRTGIRTYYRCEMDLVVDGRPYTLIAGGEHCIWAGLGFGSGGIEHNWHPFAAAVKLNDHECLLAIPPSPEGAILLAQASVNARRAGVPSDFLPYMEAPFPTHAVPLVYLFDRAEAPRRAEVFAMRAALLEPGTRVQLSGMRLLRSDADVRATATSVIPWLEPFEEWERVLSPYPSIGLAMRSPEYQRWNAKWGDGFRNTRGDVVVASWLGGYRAVLLASQSGGVLGEESRAEFASLNRALAKGEEATSWLRLSNVTATQRAFAETSDPRVGEFRSEWDGRTADPFGVSVLQRAGDELTIGGVAFQRTASGRIQTRDGSVRGVVASHVTLGDLGGGVRIPGGGNHRSAFRSILSPRSAGLPVS